MIKVQDLIAKFKEALDNKWGYIWGTAGVMWTEEKQNAATNCTEPREQTVKWGSKWIGHYVADCSGLFSWAFKQLGGYMYHGSNTMYSKYCTKHGEIKDLAKPIPGMAVFKYSDQYANPYYHVGLYIGDNTVIEAKGTYYGVTTSKLSEWSHWGWLKGVEDTPTGIDISSDEFTFDYPTLQYGSKGSYVTELQKKLIKLGYNVGSKGADGIFGKDTKAGVKAFQETHGLVVDGIVGKNTWKCLIDEYSKSGDTKYNVKVYGVDRATMLELTSRFQPTNVEEC